MLNTTPEVVKPLAAIALELSKLSSYTGRDLAAHRSVKRPVKTPERSSFFFSQEFLGCKYQVITPYMSLPTPPAKPGKYINV